MSVCAFFGSSNFKGRDYKIIRDFHFVTHFTSANHEFLSWEHHETFHILGCAILNLSRWASHQNMTHILKFVGFGFLVKSLLISFLVCVSILEVLQWDCVGFCLFIRYFYKGDYGMTIKLFVNLTRIWKEHYVWPMHVVECETWYGP